MIAVYYQFKKNIEKCFPQAREMALLVKYQSHKHQNLGLDFQTPYKNLSVTCTQKPGAGKLGIGQLPMDPHSTLRSSQAAELCQ